MPSLINKRLLKHLAALAHIELGKREEEKLFADVQKIIAHFDELKEIETTSVAPMTGGTLIKNAFREDDVHTEHDAAAEREAFPEHKDGFLKVPPVLKRHE